MKKYLILLGMVLGGALVAEATIPTFVPFLIGDPEVIDTGVLQPKTSGSSRLYGTSYNTLDEEHLVV